MNHKGTMTIHTDRLVLRAFCMDDVEPMYRNWASDDAVTRFLTWPTHGGRDVTKWVVESWCAENGNPERYHWAIELKSIKEPVGSISAVKIDERTSSVSVGYCIGRSWWRQGITSEALGAVIAFFFDQAGANCVNACHDPRNPNSGKVMKKCGMTYEGTWRAGGFNNQGVCDESWYSILREEYDRRKAIPDYDIWNSLYDRAISVQKERKVSSFIDAGGVAAAILTKGGNVYVGVCIDTAASLGMCAERNAIANMLTNGESQIDKVVAVMPDGRVGSPCGACREYMMQLDPESGDIEILLDLDKKRTARLKDLIPDWWGFC